MVLGQESVVGAGGEKGTTVVRSNALHSDPALPHVFRFVRFALLRTHDQLRRVAACIYAQTLPLFGRS